MLVFNQISLLHGVTP